jgi:hypothetical protein
VAGFDDPRRLVAPVTLAELFHNADVRAADAAEWAEHIASARLEADELELAEWRSLLESIRWRNRCFPPNARSAPVA